MTDQAQEAPTVYTALTMALHPDGWKLHMMNGGNAAQPIRLKVSDVEQIARVIGDAVIAEGLETPPYELVRSATLGLKKRVDDELQEAEATAKTIPALRRARQEIDNIQ